MGTVSVCEDENGPETVGGDSSTSLCWYSGLLDCLKNGSKAGCCDMDILPQFKREETAHPTRLSG